MIVYYSMHLGQYLGGNLSWFCKSHAIVEPSHMGRDLSDISLYQQDKGGVHYIITFIRTVDITKVRSKVPSYLRTIYCERRYEGI